MTLYPLTFAPIFKGYTWGGRKLGDVLGRAIPDGKVAESWEISDHPSGPTTVSAGALAGETLGALLHRFGRSLVGRRNEAAVAAGRFPLLIKLLDAHEWLSVQVHPRDGDGQDEPGKTEMWVVLHADPGAELILGLDGEVEPSALRAAIDEGGLDRLLHRVPASAGDAFLVPAGTVHAIGPGLLLAEIQQTSDTTYRLYDWDRPEDAEAPRPLHVAEGLSVLDYGAIRPSAAVTTVREEAGRAVEVLAETPYFRTERTTLRPGENVAGDCDGSTFEIWGVLEGAATIRSESAELRLEAVKWSLLPAELGRFEVRAEERSTLLRVTTPEPS